MTWEAVAAIGQAAGAVAVVVSLLFLAAQVRHNTGAMKAATADSKLASGMEILRMMIEDGEVARIVRVGAQNPSALSEDDRFRFVSLVTFNLMSAETTLFHHRKGTLDPQLWESTRAKFVATITMPGWRVVWQLRRGSYSAEFQRYVDALLAESHQEGLIAASDRMGDSPAANVEASSPAAESIEKTP